MWGILRLRSGVARVGMDRVIVHGIWFGRLIIASRNVAMMTGIVILVTAVVLIDQRRPYR